MLVLGNSACAAAQRWTNPISHFRLIATMAMVALGVLIAVDCVIWLTDSST